MKVQCGQCPAKYAVVDERVQGRKVRIHCKRCGAAIVVDGKVDPPLVTSTPARPSVRPTAHPAPPPESEPPPERVPESRPSPRPVAHTIMGGLEAPAAAHLQEAELEAQRQAPHPGAPSGEAAPARGLPAEHRGFTEPPAGTDTTRWRVALTKQDLRWMTTAEIIEAYRAGAVKLETFVFRSGMPTWVTLPEVPEIAAALTEAGIEVGPGSSLPPPRSPSSMPPPRRIPPRGNALEANALAALAALDEREPLPFALVTERSNGASPEAPHVAPREAAPPPAPARPHLELAPLAHADPAVAERLSAPERLSIEAMPVDTLSIIPDEPAPPPPPPFAAARQASSSNRWLWLVVVAVVVLAAGAAYVASLRGVRLL